MSKLLKSLLLQSAVIQKKIEEEGRPRAGNWLRILRLKKLRLRIKDRIHSLAGPQAEKLFARRLSSATLLRN